MGTDRRDPELSGLATALDGLCATDLAGLSDAELADRVRGLERAQRRLGAAMASTLATFEARQVQVGDGQRSVASWMAKECNTDRNQSARELRRARALRHMPLVATAFGSGELTAGHVDLLARARKVSPPAFVRDEALLVGYAIDLEFAEFRRALDYWRQLAEPDDAEDHASRLFQQRNLHASTTSTAQ